MYYYTVAIKLFISIALCFAFGAANDNNNNNNNININNYPAIPRPVYGYRKGNPTHTHSCDHVRKGVPENLRHSQEMKPSGIDSKFYQKYTEAYGIPVLSTNNVPDTALKRACYILRFLLADNSKVRTAFYKMSGRVAVKAMKENTTAFPEFRDLNESYNTRAAGGLGATPRRPLCLARVDNILCYKSDPYFREDIFLHELSHGVHLLGATYGIRGWDSMLRKHYADALKDGLYKNTYAATDRRELFGEMVQSYFNVNTHRKKADGINGPTSTRSRLMNYDPVMYELIREIFPCDNSYLKRCNTTRALEKAQVLKMDCDLYPDTGLTCKDEISFCESWVNKGYCANSTYSGHMKTNCAKSCGHCKITTDNNDDDDDDDDDDDEHKSVNSTCYDKDEKNCAYWARKGYCEANSTYQATVEKKCQKSCGYCGSNDNTNNNDEDKSVNSTCFDKNEKNCAYWAKKGYCDANSKYQATLEKKCQKSCGYCNKTIDNNDNNNEDKSVNSTCFDKDEKNCAYWVIKGYCDANSKYQATLEKKCQKSCGYCDNTTIDDIDNKNEDESENSTCFDKDEKNCAYWVRKGYCEANSTYQATVEKKCQKSCGYCGRDDNDDIDTKNEDKRVNSTCFDKDEKNCAYWAQKGYCDANSKYRATLEKKCQKSCGYCDSNDNDNTTNEAENNKKKQCRDEDVKNCEKWAKKGYCSNINYRESLKKKCRKSCHFCE